MSKELLHTPEGVRDIYGKEYARKLVTQQILHQRISSYGYDEIQTPTFEYFDVFSREIGTTPSRDLYKFFDKTGDTLVLRPDFTPSIARCAAKYFMDESIPLRFCYVGNTFINTSNLQGKLKEVTQMGAELINDDSVQADAEMISMVLDALKSTGLKHFQLTIGQVEYFKGLCQEAGLDEDTEYDLREYISGKNYFAAEELLQERQVKEPYRSVFLKVADMFGNMTSLAEARKLVNNERSLKALERLEKIYEVLELYGVSKHISFDLGMLSKYNYYTGVIFKAYTFGVGDAIVKGGRYNNLLKQFGKNAPAVGFVIAVDDILEAMMRQNIDLPLLNHKQQIIYHSGNYPEKLSEAMELRRQGIRTELVPDRQELHENE